MPVFKPRDRIVIFRLTQDEYDSLVTVCQKRGARNLTDFTRSEVLASIARELQSNARASEPKVLDEKLDSLQSEIHYIRALLEQQMKKSYDAPNS